MSDTLELEDRVKALEDAMKKLREADRVSNEVRELGIRNGSKGVAAAFVLVFLVWMTNAAFVWSNKPAVLTQEFLGLCFLSGVLLLAFFGFTYGFSVRAIIGKWKLMTGANLSDEKAND